VATAVTNQTLAEGRAFEEVAPGEIEQALERQRRAAENGGSVVVRASVANLVVVTPNRAAGQRALAAVEDLGARAPSRCVVLIAEPPEGRPVVRAWTRVVHRRPAAGPEVVWEEVVVQTNVHPRHLTAVVLPLLLPDLPVFTWWQGTPPFAEEVFDELTSVTDRLIVDSAAFADPVADLARLASAAAVLEARVSDCAWSRLMPWRELLAAPFGGPPLREAVHRARWLRVDAVEPTAGLLLVGWMASRLDWQLDTVRVGGDERSAGYRTATGACQARVAGAIGSVNLTRVHLELETEDGPASVRVEAPPVHLVATVEAPGQPTWRRKVGRSGGGGAGPAGLGDDLQVLGRDRMFEEALVEAAALAEANPG
jgi:glucose-6-phosphate dehydrogenase assembly protein OpcA